MAHRTSRRCRSSLSRRRPPYMSRSVLRLLSVSFVPIRIFSTAVQAQTFSTPCMQVTQGKWATERGFSIHVSFILSGSWVQSIAATGDWEGVRNHLSDANVFVVNTYTSESANNPVGGNSQELRYTHKIALGVTLDPHTLLGPSDTYFLASASTRTGNSLSYDISNCFQVQEIFGQQTLRLVDLAVEKLFLDKKSDIVGSRINALDDCARSPPYCFAHDLGFCGNLLSIPVNASVSSYLDAVCGIRARYEASLECYSITGG